MWLVTCFWRERWNPSSLSQGLELGCGKFAKGCSRTIWCIYQIQFLALLRLSLRDPASTGEPVQVNLTRLGLVSGVALHTHSASWADRKCSWDYLLLQLSWRFVAAFLSLRYWRSAIERETVSACHLLVLCRWPRVAVKKSTLHLAARYTQSAKRQGGVQQCFLIAAPHFSNGKHLLLSHARLNELSQSFLLQWLSFLPSSQSSLLSSMTFHCSPLFFNEASLIIS